MSEYSKRLGKVVYKKRKALKLTQTELAERTGVTEQTIRKIEHGNGNPQLSVLGPLIKDLQIDPMEIFYSQENNEDGVRKPLDILLSECNDRQIIELLPVFKAVIDLAKNSGITATE